MDPSSNQSSGYPSRGRNIQYQSQDQTHPSSSGFGASGSQNSGSWSSSSATQQQLPSLPSMLYSPSMQQTGSRRGSAGSGGNSGASSPYHFNSIQNGNQHQQLPSFPNLYNPLPLPQSGSLQPHPQLQHQTSSLSHQPPFSTQPADDQRSSGDVKMDDPPTDRNSTSIPKGKRKANSSVKQEQEAEDDQGDEEGKPKKRITRVNRACAQCRVKKRRCDGAQPVCSVCNVLSEPCSYDDNEQKRGPKKGPRQNPKETARIKISSSLQKSISSLISKCGPEAAREDIARILSEHALDFGELLNASGHGKDHEDSPQKRPKPTHAEPHSAISSLTNTPNSLAEEKELPRIGGSHDRTVQMNIHGGKQADEEDELDPDFLATNDRGDLMHRGSSSGIGLLHRRPNHSNLSSPLQTHQPTMQSSHLRTSSGGANIASQQDSHSGGSPSSSVGAGTPKVSIPRNSSHGSTSGLATNPTSNGPVSIPMAHPPRHGSATPRSSPSRTSSPARESNTTSFQISEGAMAHRDHILNSLSSGPGERSRHSSPALRGRALTPSASKANAPTSEVDQSRECSSSSGTASGVRAIAEMSSEQPNGMVIVDFEPDPTLSSEEHARLFRFYYQGVHPFWPLLYKPALDAIPLEDLRHRLAPVLLYSIYAIASCVVPGEKRAQEAEALRAGEKEASKEADIEEDWENSAAERYFRCAERYLYDGRLRPDVSAIQACFLLSLYSHGSGELSRAYVFCGLASSMAMDLGLHRFPIHKTSLLYDSVERETRVRLIWHVYILGVMLSAEMGRPVMFRARDCDAPLLNEKEDDEFERWSDMQEMYGPESFAKQKIVQSTTSNGEGEKETAGHRLVHAPSCLNWGVRMFIIVERILSEVHSFRRKATLRKQGNATRILAEIDAELDQWRENLPPHLWLQMPDEAAKAQAGDEGISDPSQVKKSSTAAFEGEPVPSFFALDLWLWTATLLLHRPFIPQDPGLSVNDILSNDSHQKSTKAANAICDRLMAFSASGAPVDRLSTDLGYCLFTASVMFWFNSTLPHEEISRDAKQRFALCKEWLKRLSRTWPAASAHRQLLDGFATIGEGEAEGGDIDALGSTADDTWNASADQSLNRRKSNIDPNGAVVAWQQQQINHQRGDNQESSEDQRQTGYSGSGDLSMSSSVFFPYPNQSRTSFSNPFNPRETQEQKQQLIDYYASNSLHRGNRFPNSSQYDVNGGANAGIGSQAGGQMMNAGWGFDAPASIFDIEHLYWNETTQPTTNVYAQVPNFQPQPLDGGDAVAPQGFYSGRRRSFQPAQSAPASNPQLPSTSTAHFPNASSSTPENTNGLPSASPSTSNSSGHSQSHPAAEGLISLATASGHNAKPNTSMGPPATPGNIIGGFGSSFRSPVPDFDSGNQDFNRANLKPNFQSSQSLSQSQSSNSHQNAGRLAGSSRPGFNNQGQNQDSSANISPFSFQVDQPWSDIMSILQLPPSFNS